MPVAVFDLDGTLVDQSTAAQSWAEEFVDQWNLPAEAIERVAFVLTERGSKEMIFDRLVEEWSLPTSGSAVWAEYRKRMPELVHCTPENKLALTELRSAGWKIGIVTNGMADNQEGKIRATGLADLVDGWVISGEIGVRKPEPRIFEVLAQRIGCALEGWMVGDSLENDVLGGASVGLRTVWIAPDDAETADTGVRFDIRRASVAEAVAAILAADLPRDLRSALLFNDSQPLGAPPEPEAFGCRDSRRPRPGRGEG